MLYPLKGRVGSDKKDKGRKQVREGYENMKKALTIAKNAGACSDS